MTNTRVSQERHESAARERRSMATSAAAATGPKRILIVDDHPAVREGLAAQIALQPDLEICGEAEGMNDALALLQEVVPDVAVVDISLKTGDGIELVKRIRSRNEQTRVVVWSMFDESLYAERALRAGAIGYVHKGLATREIVHAIRCALAGKLYLNERVSKSLLSRLAVKAPTDRSPIERLADRELETFRLMGCGLTTAQIARQMRLSAKTVETYRSRIKEKLGLGAMTELIRRAAQFVLENG